MISDLEPQDDGLPPIDALSRRQVDAIRWIRSVEAEPFPFEVAPKLVEALWDASPRVRREAMSFWTRNLHVAFIEYGGFDRMWRGPWQCPQDPFELECNDFERALVKGLLHVIRLDEKSRREALRLLCLIAKPPDFYRPDISRFFRFSYEAADKLYEASRLAPEEAWSLTNDDNPIVVANALNMFGRTEPRVQERVWALLGHPNSRMRAIGLHLFRAGSPEEADERIGPLLGDPDVANRDKARKKIDEAPLDEIELLETGTNQDPRRRANLPSWYLYNRPADAERLVWEMTKDPDGRVRAKALIATEGLQREATLEEWLSALREDPSPAVKCAAAFELRSWLGKSRSVDSLRNLLLDEDEDVRYWGVFLSAEANQEALYPLIVQAIERGCGYQPYAWTSLVHGRQRVPLLDRCIASDCAELRRIGAYELVDQPKHMSKAQWRTRLARLEEDPQNEVRAVVAYAYATTGLLDQVDPILATLSPRRQASVLCGYWRNNTAESRARLEALLSSSHFEVRWAARLCLRTPFTQEAKGDEGTEPAAASSLAARFSERWRKLI